jgi:DNA primase
MTTSEILNPKNYKRIGLLFPEILEYYGYDATKAFCWSDTRIRMACPIHKGDNKTSFVWNREYLTWHCFSRECHRMNGNNTLGFIMSMEDCTIDEACVIATKIVESHKEIMIERRQEIRGAYSKSTHLSQKKLYDIDCRKATQSNYATNRGILSNVQQKYYIGTYIVAGLHRLTVPIFDINSRLVGLSARKTIESDNSPKWLHLPTGFKASINLYNIHAFKPKNGTIILAEGPLDVLRFESARIHNSVAAFGSHISNEQIKLLNEFNITEVIIAFDNDQAGEKGACRAAKHLRDFGYKALRMRWDLKYNDIGEIPIRNLRRYEWSITDI